MQAPILAAILDTLDEAVLVFDRTGRCVLAGRRVGDLFGVDQGSLIGRNENEVVRTLAAACEEPDALAAFASAGAGPALQACEIELVRPRPRVARMQSSPIVDERGSAGWICLVRDVTRERSAERRAQQLLVRLEQITATDALTRLPNRRRFLEELDREHGRAARAWDSYAIVRIDIDGHGALNATYGHPRGDEVLEQVADRIRTGRREYDLIARFEADEFIVLLPGADATAAQVVAERMQKAVCATPFELGEKVIVTASVGAAIWIPPSGEVGPDVVHRAGEALRIAKKRGPSALEIDAGSSSKA